MAHYLSERLVVGTLAERPDGGNPTGGSQQLTGPLYLATDTRELYAATGHGWTLLGTLAAGGSSPSDATTSVSGLVEVDHAPSGAHPVALTTDGLAMPSGLLGTTSGKATAGNDGRLSDARTPTAHEASHLPAGGDAIDWTGKIHAKGTHAGRPAAAAANAGCLYSETDTGSTFRSDGTTWLLIAVNSGTGIDGLTSDGNHGIIVQEALTAGDSTKADFPDLSTIHGTLAVTDTPGNNVDGDPVLLVSQVQSPSTGNLPQEALHMSRAGDISAADYVRPLMTLDDQSLSAQVLTRWKKGGVAVTEINGAGGIGLYAHAAPATQPTVTITTSTITDAVAKAAIHALILLINGCGLAAITEN